MSTAVEATFTEIRNLAERMPEGPYHTNMVNMAGDVLLWAVYPDNRRRYSLMQDYQAAYFAALDPQFLSAVLAVAEAGIAHIDMNVDEPGELEARDAFYSALKTLSDLAAKRVRR